MGFIRSGWWRVSTRRCKAEAQGGCCCGPQAVLIRSHLRCNHKTNLPFAPPRLASPLTSIAPQDCTVPASSCCCRRFSSSAPPALIFSTVSVVLPSFSGTAGRVQPQGRRRIALAECELREFTEGICWTARLLALAAGYC